MERKIIGKNTVTIVIVEDDPTTLDYLVEQADGAAGQKVVAACTTIAQGREAISQYQPRIVLTDLDLPDGHGTTLIAWAHQNYPNTEIAVVSVLGDESNTVKAIQAGAAGYLLKDGSALEIERCIQTLLRGESPISSGVARHIFRLMQSPPSADNLSENITTTPGLSLTKREEEVLWGIAKGMTYREVASHLEISTHTVPSHVKNIYRKLQVHSKSEAVFEALQLGLIKI